MTIEHVHPLGYTEPVRLKKAALNTICATPRCDEPTIDGKRFCATHSAQLSLVKEQIKQEGRNIKRGGLDPKAKHKNTRSKYPRCCNPLCQNSRSQGAGYCTECQDAGYMEEED